MAHTLTGLKNIRKNEKHRLRNKAIKTALKSQIRKVEDAVEKKDKTSAEALRRLADQLLDRAARKGTIHRNAAARHKSLLALKVASLK